MLFLYKYLTVLSTPALHFLLKMRQNNGKEDPARIYERKGQPSIRRPDGKMGWVHAASVGEAQSALIVIKRLLDNDPDLHILLTSGTRTSAAFMAEKLPNRAFHQYMPLDHAGWVNQFLDHWQPDFALWMESELWPNMLGAIKARNIPAALVNGRLSDKSFKRWSGFRSSAQHLLETFTLILTQTDEDATRFKDLGAKSVKSSGNIKYSAAPLPVNEKSLTALVAKIRARPHWVFASTHKGEEAMAARIQQSLKKTMPDVLTIIVPRHPDRAQSILEGLDNFDLNVAQRSAGDMPEAATDIYLADTLGELGLFYTISDIAVIGRSFSDDGGGGHNPIEAAQLDCAVLYGPKVQFQREIYDDMKTANAALLVKDEKTLEEKLRVLLLNPKDCQTLQNQAHKFAASKAGLIDDVMESLTSIVNPPEVSHGIDKKKAL